MQMTQHHHQYSPLIDLVGVTTLVSVFGGRINSSPAKKKGFGTKKKGLYSVFVFGSLDLDLTCTSRAAPWRVRPRATSDHTENPNPDPYLQTRPSHPPAVSKSNPAL
jgi:hypothetical protein